MVYLLNQLLSESSVKYPDQEAVFFKNEKMSYADLERESNKLAYGLAENGVKKGERIGIYMNRCPASLVGVFGILKVGANYVPIDPLCPQGRLNYILKKCRIKFIVTLQNTLEKIAKALSDDIHLQKILVMNGLDKSFEPLKTVRLIDWQKIRGSLKWDAFPTNTIDSDIAYILFTSGSTGNPKGVMLSHRNSLTFINSACEFFQITTDDRLSNICPLHFDMSVFDIFVAIKAGATIVMIPETTSMFPVKLAETIANKKITVWNSVPSALSLLSAYKNLDSHDLSSLRLILFAGELFPLKYLQRLKELLLGARFCNMYGQTEANSSTYYWVDKVPSDAKAPLPIGRPLPNFEVFALNEKGKQVTQPGEEGELYVRAPTVALGYWDEDEKTEKSFVKNPLRPDLDERIYKTGDLVHLDSDGNYVFLGRKDHMIKSRGYRIEIGEIEIVLCNHPEIRNAVVVPIPDELIGNRISVLIVLFNKDSITKEEILRYCFQQLPKYMIPEIVEFRDSLPKTSSGKVDRKKLSESVGRFSIWATENRLTEGL